MGIEALAFAHNIRYVMLGRPAVAICMDHSLQLLRTLAINIATTVTIFIFISGHIYDFKTQLHGTGSHSEV